MLQYLFLPMSQPDDAGSAFLFVFLAYVEKVKLEKCSGSNHNVAFVRNANTCNVSCVLSRGQGLPMRSKTQKARPSAGKAVGRAFM